MPNARAPGGTTSASAGAEVKTSAAARDKVTSLDTWLSR